MAAFGELLDVLGAMYAADGKTTHTFIRARVQNLQRAGIPFDVRPGKGARVDYGRDDVCQIAFAFELFELGLGITPAVEVIRAWWPGTVGPAFAEEWERIDALDEDLRLFISMWAMSYQWGGNDPKIVGPTLAIKRHRSLAGERWTDAFESFVRGSRSAVVMNVSKMVQDLKKGFDK